MNLWGSVDLSGSMRSYEYTKYTKYQIYRTIDSDDFKTMDSKTIFEFISNKMEIVAFNDYLKRYLYRISGLEEDFKDISDSVYLDAIKGSFIQNQAPYAFTPVKSRMATVMKSWLKAESVKRTTIFVLGFGLRMSDKDVDEFLTKVNKEESFDFGNHEETIYWYCFHNDKRYSKAKELMEYYEELEPLDQGNESLWQAMCHDPKMYIHSENELIVYLKYLKTYLGNSDPAFEEFKKLYDRVRVLIASIRNDSAFIDGSAGKTLEMEDISPSDVEETLYTAIPSGTNGNLMKMSASLLSKQFRNKRMSRQHISFVLSGKRKPERFDMITMLFFIYANDISYSYGDDPENEGIVARFKDYMDEINQILNRCNMVGIYPVNPYEAFILMCLVTDDPLGAYYDVWNYSFTKA